MARPALASGPAPVRLLYLAIPTSDGSATVLLFEREQEFKAAITFYPLTAENSSVAKPFPRARFEALWKLVNATELAPFAVMPYDARLDPPPTYYLMISLPNAAGEVVMQFFRVPLCGNGLEAQHALVREIARDLLPNPPPVCAATATRSNPDK
jgi:hypothetical protein